MGLKLEHWERSLDLGIGFSKQGEIFVKVGRC